MLSSYILKKNNSLCTSTHTWSDTALISALECSLLLHVRVYLLLLFKLILSVVSACPNLMCRCPILYLCKQARILRFDYRCNFFKSRVSLSHVEVGQLEFVGDKRPQGVLVSLLKVAAIELDVFVFYWLLEYQFCRVIHWHGQLALVVGRIFETVINHFNQHCRVFAELNLQLLLLPNVLEFELVNTKIILNKNVSLTSVCRRRSSRDRWIFQF